ncbi:MAG: hypothetical protein GXO86_13515 [Chlorobi bacterium]|nr:hypothetical protein [Chlorobiota bacterium]
MDVDGSGQPWEYTDSKAVRISYVNCPNPVWTADEWFISTSATAAEMTPDWYRKTLTWTGASSSGWSDPANWTDQGTVSSFAPDAGCDIVIENTSNNPEITTEASCNSILVKSNATITVRNGSKLFVGSISQ